MIKWNFPLLGGGGIEGPNDGNVLTFSGKDLIRNLAREVCQNSLDAKHPDSDEPVHVDFNMVSLDSDNDVFSGIRFHIDQCGNTWDKNPKFNKFFIEATKTLNREAINSLIVSDYNTTGLPGARDDDFSQFFNLTKSSGFSDKDGGSGGSFGLGKNAAFACSSLNTVFYNTYCDDERAFQGTLKLPSHCDENGEYTQRNGYFENCIDKSKTLPIFENDNHFFMNLFPRNKTGTDIIILGFKNESSWVEDIEAAILDNFYIAIYEKNLSVSINGFLINHENIESKIFDELICNQKTKDSFSAFINRDFYFQNSIFENDDIELYISFGSNFKKTISKFRQNGMLISLNSKTKINQRYAAVVLVRGEQLGNLLRLCEPPKHDRWEAANIEDDEDLKKKASSIIKNMDEWIFSTISDAITYEYSESIDSSVGEYLSSDLTNNQKNIKKEEKDLLVNPKILISGIKKPSSRKISGNDSVGSKMSGNVNNKIPENIQKFPRELPPPVNPNIGSTPGVAPQDGEKIITYPEYPQITNQRVFCINPDRGHYRTILYADSMCSDVYISLGIVEEDGTIETDSLTVISYQEDTKIISVENNLIGPLELSPQEFKKIDLRIDTKEKLCLNLNVIRG